jgi:hypothetical protein
MLFSRMNAGYAARLSHLTSAFSRPPLLARSLTVLFPLKIQPSRKRAPRERFAVSRLKRSRMNTCTKFIRNSSEMNTYEIAKLRSCLE